MSALYRIRIEKEDLKFSAAHMTVFADGTKESLHGHNFQVSLVAEFSGSGRQLKEMLEFSIFKKEMRAICHKWDEKLLLPSKCAQLVVLRKNKKETEFTLCRRRYVVPSEEIVFLPLENIITESLAEEFTRLLMKRLASVRLDSVLHAVEVHIEETHGQGASYLWRRKG